MNFRENFEAWHRAKFGYCEPPPKGFTAFNCVYRSDAQQKRWEGWQACVSCAWDEGYAKGKADIDVATRAQG